MKELMSAMIWCVRNESRFLSWGMYKTTRNKDDHIPGASRYKHLIGSSSE